MWGYGILEGFCDMLVFSKIIVHPKAFYESSSNQYNKSHRLACASVLLMCGVRAGSRSRSHSSFFCVHGAGTNTNTGAGHQPAAHKGADALA